MTLGRSINFKYVNLEAAQLYNTHKKLLVYSITQIKLPQSGT